jgi:hypothetical protein
MKLSTITLPRIQIFLIIVEAVQLRKDSGGLVSKPKNRHDGIPKSLFGKILP